MNGIEVPSSTEAVSDFETFTHHFFEKMDTHPTFFLPKWFHGSNWTILYGSFSWSSALRKIRWPWVPVHRQSQ
jgi:hypothetical protein